MRKNPFLIFRADTLLAFELVFGAAFFQGDDDDEASFGEKYVTDDLVDFDEWRNEKVLLLK